MFAGKIKLPFQILFEHRPQYLSVAVWGVENSYYIAREYWQRIVAMTCRRHYERILIRKDFETKLLAAEKVAVMNEVAHSVKDVRVAVVDRHYDPKDRDFQEMVCINRGLTLRIFGDVREAEDWLMSDLPVLRTGAFVEPARAMAAAA